MNVFGFACLRLEMLNGDTVLCRAHVVDLDALTKFHIFVILQTALIQFPLFHVMAIDRSQNADMDHKKDPFKRDAPKRKKKKIV